MDTSVRTCRVYGKGQSYATAPDKGTEAQSLLT
jgi:hypothetical protein